VNNGSGWNVVWTNEWISGYASRITENGWNLRIVDLSKYANNQEKVQIRFRLTSDYDSYVYSGWNIDNFEVLGLPEELKVKMSANPLVVSSGNTTEISVNVRTTYELVDDATVTLWSSEGGEFTPAIGKTGSSGNFTSIFTAPTVSSITKCMVVANVSKTYYENGTAYLNLTIVPSDTPLLVVYVRASHKIIQSLRETTIEISVSNGSSPVENATLILESDLGGNFENVTGTTNSTGEFSTIFTTPLVYELSVCRVTCTANKTGYVDGAGETLVILVPPPKLTMNITPAVTTLYTSENCTITFQVMNGSTPVVGANISIVLVTNGGSCVPSYGYTDIVGEFECKFYAPIVTTTVQCKIFARASKQYYIDADQSTEITVSAHPKVTVITPNGGELWYKGKGYEIKWTAEYGIGDLSINIEYSTTGMNGTYDTIAGGLKNTGTYTWNIPDTVPTSSDCYVRIIASDVNYVTGNDTSDSNFTIVPPPVPSINLTVPNGGELWVENTYRDIKWSASGGTGDLRITLEYSTQGSSGPWNPIVSDYQNIGSYSWLVPKEPSSDCYIKATVKDSFPTPQSSYDLSDTNFTIVTKLSVGVESPNGGELLYVDDIEYVTWNTSGGHGKINITIEYSTTGSAGPWHEINNGSYSHENDGNESWTIPYAISHYCLIKITAVDESLQTTSDMSDNMFTIDVRRPQVLVESPDGGETLYVGETYLIKWNACNGTPPLKIKLEYSVAGHPGPYELIAKDLANVGSYNWTIPDNITRLGYIRITVVDNCSVPQTAIDTSNSSFIIAYLPKISVTSPVGGENWTSGTEQDIVWQAKYGVEPLVVKLEYKTSLTGSYIEIADNLPKIGVKNWTVPNVKSTECYIRATVTDINNRTAYVETGNFTIWPEDKTPPTISHIPANTAYEGVSILINATVVDDVKVKSVVLYYRKIGDTSYMSADMAHVSANLYQTKIPASVVTIVGVQYYIESTDISGNTVTKPADTPKEHPYTIKVVPTKGSVSGNVIDTLGNPIASATITVKSAVTGKIVETVYTNPDGKFNVTVSLDIYDVIASKEGYTEFTERVSLTVSQPHKEITLILKIILVQGTIKGKVVNETEEPIRDAIVEIVYSTNFSVVAKYTTDENGEFNITVPLGTFNIKISKFGYYDYTKSNVTLSKTEPSVDIGTVKLQKVPKEIPPEERPPEDEVPIVGIIAPAVMVIIVLLIFLYLVMRKRKPVEKRVMPMPPPPPTEVTIPTEAPPPPTPPKEPAPEVEPVPPEGPPRPPSLPKEPPTEVTIPTEEKQPSEVKPRPPTSEKH
jgi:hypothetical protein